MTENRNKLDIFQGFLEKDPDNHFARYAVGIEYRKLEDFANAIKTFEELRSRDPKNLALYYQLGEMYDVMGRLDDAVETFTVGIQLAAGQGDHKTQQELEEIRKRVQEKA